MNLMVLAVIQFATHLHNVLNFTINTKLNDEVSIHLQHQQTTTIANCLALELTGNAQNLKTVINLHLQFRCKSMNENTMNRWSICQLYLITNSNLKNIVLTSGSATETCL